MGNSDKSVPGDQPEHGIVDDHITDTVAHAPKRAETSDISGGNPPRRSPGISGKDLLRGIGIGIIAIFAVLVISSQLTQTPSTASTQGSTQPETVDAPGAGDAAAQPAPDTAKNAMAPPKDIAHQSTNELIAQYDPLEEECRGGAGGADGPACTARDSIGRELEHRGMCVGNDWHPCSRSEKRRNATDSSGVDGAAADAGSPGAIKKAQGADQEAEQNRALSAEYKRLVQRVIRRVQPID